MLLLPLTVTVATYVPAASPVFGFTVNWLFLFAAMLLTEVLFSSKLDAFAPLNEIMSFPVGELPVLFIVMLCGGYAP